jgi:hypothetical protein
VTRRNFINGIVSSFFILPSALTYTRTWKEQRGLVVPNEYLDEYAKKFPRCNIPGGDATETLKSWSNLRTLFSVGMGVATDGAIGRDLNGDLVYND